MFEAQTEWTSPESFPDLKNHKYIAIDLETRDPNLKSNTWNNIRVFHNVAEAREKTSVENVVLAIIKISHVS